MDWFLIKSVNPEYPLSCHKCVEKLFLNYLCQKLTHQNWPKGVLGYVLNPNLTKKFQWEVSPVADQKFSITILLGGLSVNLNHLKSQLFSMAHDSPLSTSHPRLVTPSPRKKICWRHPILEIYSNHSNVLEFPKVDMCQNWPKGVLGYVLRCFESKFDRKNSNEKCPQFLIRNSQSLCY